MMISKKHLLKIFFTNHHYYTLQYTLSPNVNYIVYFLITLLVNLKPCCLMHYYKN